MTDPDAIEARPRRGPRRPWGGVGRWLLPLLLALLLLPAATAREKDDIAALPEKYQQWLAGVEKLITKAERKAFLEIEKDYQRDAFIEHFWKARDPYPQTSRNEFRDEWEERHLLAAELFGDLGDERAQMLLINGHPTLRIEADCVEIWPAEVWFYSGREFHGGDVLLLFYRKWGAGHWRLWSSLDSVEDLGRSGGLEPLRLSSACGEHGDAILSAMGFARNLGPMGQATLTAQMSRPRDMPRGEWVASFQAYSTDLEEGEELFDAALQVAYPGRYQSRTILQAAIAASIVDLGVATLGDYASYNLMLTGEVLKEETLFDSFRIKYDFTTAEVRPAIEAAEAGFGRDAGAALPLVFERYLRAGDYRLIVKVEDVNSGRVFRVEHEIEVPDLGGATVAPPLDPETARVLAEANRAIRSGETTVTIGPLQGEWQTGMVRIDALTTGDDIAEVSFLLDGEVKLTKKTEPFNVELNLGDVPRARLLRVEAYDQTGLEIASDEVLLNGGRHRFAVRLVEPRRGKTYTTSLRAEVDVTVPEGEGVERVELYLNESLVATLYQPPYVQPIVLPAELPVAYVRAVAYTPDGNATEDLVFINAPEYLEEIDIEYVELFTTVLDRQKRPALGLDETDFRIAEDGVPQQILRFEKVENLPIHAAVMLDVSASMVDRLDAAQGAALHFFEQAITPKDRATVVTFNDHPNLTVTFTNDLTRLAGGLAGVAAERGTALWDSLVFTLYYFNGIKGQRAILLLSDGKDESSRFPFEDALEYARRAGVTLYAVGLDLAKGNLDARRKLSRLSGETGGRVFFIDDVSELDQVYDTIQRELRSRYLLTYQSTNTSGRKEFRTIEVTLRSPGLEAKTLRGYYP